MQIGITVFVTDQTIDIVTLARHVERLGFESLWVPEHPVVPAELATPWPGSADGVLPEFYKRCVDPFVGLAGAAVATERIVLGTSICLVPERNPLYMAKEIATLDGIAKGRFQFGIGAGWLEEEGAVFKVDWRRRWTQTREYIQAMKALWGQHPAEFHGSYVDFPPLWCYPKPVQKPHPPILIAGELERSASRVAEYADGWMPRARAIDPAGVEAGRKKIEALYAEQGRDPKSITVSIYGHSTDLDSARQFADAGADRVIVMLPSEDEASTVQRLEALASARG